MELIQPRRLQSAFASGQLTGALQATDAVLTSDRFTLIPAISTPQHMPLVLGGTTQSALPPEIVYVLSHSAGSTQLTVRRAQENTVGQAWPAGTSWNSAPLPSDNELIPVQDTRSANSLPNSYSQQITYEFKTATAIGLPTDFAPNNNGFVCVQTIAQWLDSSGGTVVQIAFTGIMGQTGSNYYPVNGRPAMAMRSGSGTTWNTWRFISAVGEPAGPLSGSLVTSAASLNSSLPAGFYDCPPGTTGTPTSDWYMVVVMRHRNSQDNNYSTQIASHFFSQAMYRRTCQGGDPTNAASWGTWERIGGGDTAWTPISNLGYTNGWANYNTAEWYPLYRKDALGWVHLRGLIISGTAAVPAFTMPVGYRPARSELFTTWANPSFCRTDVTAAGQVIPRSQDGTGATSGYVSLSAMTWLAEG